MGFLVLLQEDRLSFPALLQEGRLSSQDLLQGLVPEVLPPGASTGGLSFQADRHVSPGPGLGDLQGVGFPRLVLPESLTEAEAAAAAVQAGRLEYEEAAWVSL